MKKTKIIYWIITGLIAAYMIFTAVPNAMNTSESIAFINGGLGYPEYFIPFIGVAKILGGITILIPAFKRLKEWAYAGLFFDLAGATYSIIVTYGIDVTIVFMILPIVFLFLSYFLWHKINPAT